MTTYEPRLRQLVDWRAAIWAGLIAGLIFLLLNIILIPLVLDIGPGALAHLFGSMIIGETALSTPVISVIAVVANLALSVLFAMLLAYIIHRGGLISGIVGGALFGLALYLINFYLLSQLHPWLFAMRGWLLGITHLVFGALAGGIYEGLEVEEFVPAQE